MVTTETVAMEIHPPLQPFLWLVLDPVALVLDAPVCVCVCVCVCARVCVRGRERGREEGGRERGREEGREGGREAKTYTVREGGRGKMEGEKKVREEHLLPETQNLFCKLWVDISWPGEWE